MLRGSPTGCQRVAFLSACQETEIAPNRHKRIQLQNVGWVSPTTFDLFREMNLGFCCVDQPRLKSLLPPISEVTSAIAYVRFHGRNYAKWWKHKEAWERYDYSYSVDELKEWVPKIQQMSKEAEMTFVFVNNHWQGQAVDTARQLRMLLA